MGGGGGGEGGGDCSPVLRFDHNSHSSEQYSVHLLRISCSSVRHFPDLSWMVEVHPVSLRLDPSPAAMLSRCNLSLNFIIDLLVS